MHVFTGGVSPFAIIFPLTGVHDDAALLAGEGTCWLVICPVGDSHWPVVGPGERVGVLQDIMQSYLAHNTHVL